MKAITLLPSLLAALLLPSAAYSASPSPARPSVIQASDNTPLGARPLPGAIPTEEVPPGWYPFNQGLAQAKATKRYVLIQFFDPKCRECHQMGQEMQADPRLDDLIRHHFVLVRINRGSERKIMHHGRSLTEQQLAARHQIKDFPTLLFLAPDGNLIGRQSGYLPPAELREVLSYLSSGSYHKMEYKAFKARTSK
ncbi:MAG: hypothetical protein CVV27_09885 [Candidatus Melainabacteria bacterium HGW-Melainabacteria-1]|nr:MAG: hypothetical protein CVV27_09885 [Candidatus Melainabacteria bacterium HGW-Melainabacteria-1]